MLHLAAPPIAVPHPRTHPKPMTHPQHLAIASLTHQGRVRRRNEDAIGQATAPDGSLLCAIADGLGRYDFGHLASQTAIQSACDTWSQIPSPSLDLSDALSRTILTANLSLLSLRSADALPSPLATTAVLLGIHQSTAFIAHAGDSRAYLLRDSVLQRLTSDHTLPSPSSSPDHSWQPQSISHCLGLSENLEAELTGPIDLSPDDILLLCSDGLSRVVDDTWIETILLLFPLERSAEELIALANFLGGPDNISVFALRFQPSSSDSLSPRPPNLIFPHERPARRARLRNIILAWLLTLACIALWLVQMFSR